jgi:hypothetical protein
MLTSGCLYPYVFETRPPDSSRRMTRYQRVPNPFALYAGPTAMRSLNEGDEISVDLTVIGNASRQLPYFLRAFEIAGERGLTSRRVPFRLVRVEQVPLDASAAAETIYTPGGEFSLPEPIECRAPVSPGGIILEITTPLRLKEQGDLISPTNFAARHLLSSLIRRVSMLMYFHSDEPLAADFPALKVLASNVKTSDHDLRWLDLTRKSSRQGAMMQMGGIVGRVEIHLGEAEPLWPYLWIGQFTQAGKGTTMGLGHYRIITAAEPMAAPGTAVL